MISGSLMCLITKILLSYENWVIETELWKQSYCLPNNFFAISPTIFELWVMETKNWVMKNTLLESQEEKNSMWEQTQLHP